MNINLMYKSLLTNLVDDFYNPLLSHAVSYDRAVGYFTSGSLLLMVEGIKKFVKNNGILRLVISPFILEEDYIVIQKGTDYVRGHIQSIFTRFEEDPYQLRGAQLLWLLLNKGNLQVKVAIPRNKRGIFHEKIGLFYDKEGHALSFSGSNNETSNAILYNYESFNTYCSWIPGQNDYLSMHQKSFEDYWHQNNEELDVLDIEEAVGKDFLKKFQTEKELDDFTNTVKTNPPEPTTPPVPTPIEKGTLKFTPFPHQEEGKDAWFANEKGLLKYATGSGKTKTAIYILHELDKREKRLFTIVVVPDKTLVNQWHHELTHYSSETLKCFSDEKNWDRKFNDLVEISKVEDEFNYSIVVTNDTFFGPKFQFELGKLKENYFLIVDECHTWGTDRSLSNLPKVRRRLGLSATPELHFRPEKSEQLLNYFGGIVHEYSLSKAISDGRLVPYEYHPIQVKLTEAEKNAYDELTLKLVRMLGRDPDDYTSRISPQAEMLMFKRARIIYGAENKLEELEKRLKDVDKQGNTLIYCGPTSYASSTNDETDETSVTQLEAVNHILKKNGIKFAQYTSKENEFDRQDALSSFKNKTYSILNAIKCLDEGIDIPQIETAYILASSTNPREFIQRRGRILRNYAGKTKAVIYDFLVLEESYSSLMKKEILRLQEFARLATNKNELLNTYKREFELYLEGEEDGKRRA